MEKSAEGIVGLRQARLVRHSMPKGGATDRPSRKALNRRPERYPERGLKERRSRLPRNEGTASGEPTRRKPGGWDETVVGAARNDAPVGAFRRYARHADLICRTAVYVTRTHGGVGGGTVRCLPIPFGALG